MTKQIKPLPPVLPSVTNLEQIISESNLWKYQVTRTGLQRDKRHLAQEIHQHISKLNQGKEEL